MVEHFQEELATALAAAEIRERALQQERDDYRECYEDAKRLAREIDVAMHGESGAAKQASLCDLIGPAKNLRADRDALREALTALVKKLDAVHADLRYQAVWISYQVHGGRYDEPKYDVELKAAKAALESATSMDARFTKAEEGKACGSAPQNAGGEAALHASPQTRMTKNKETEANGSS